MPKKTHRVATVGFWSFKSQLACASGELEEVAQANAGSGSLERICAVSIGSFVLVEGTSLSVSSCALAECISCTQCVISTFGFCSCNTSLNTLSCVLTNSTQQGDCAHRNRDAKVGLSCLQVSSNCGVILVLGGGVTKKCLGDAEVISCSQSVTCVLGIVSSSSSASIGCLSGAQERGNKQQSSCVVCQALVLAVTVCNHQRTIGIFNVEANGGVFGVHCSSISCSRDISHGCNGCFVLCVCHINSHTVERRCCIKNGLRNASTVGCWQQINCASTSCPERIACPQHAEQWGIAAAQTDFTETTFETNC